MTKVRLGNLWLAAAVAGVILCAVLMRAFYMPYSGFLRTVLYNILIFSWAVSVWWRILHAQTRHCLLGAAALMLFWLDIRLIRYDFAQTPEMLRRLWYAYYIPMLLIPTLALYTLFFLDRGQSAPLYKYRYMIFVFPVVLFSLVLTNDCHQLAFAFPPGQEVLGSPDYTYRFVYYLCLLWIFSCAVFTVVYLVRRCRIPHTKRILWLPLVPIFFATLYALLYKHILNVPWMHAIAGDMTVVQCLTFTATFEACIQCGLIQSNMGYATLFEVSMGQGSDHGPGVCACAMLDAGSAAPRGAAASGAHRQCPAGRHDPASRPPDSERVCFLAGGHHRIGGPAGGAAPHAGGIA